MEGRGEGEGTGVVGLGVLYVKESALTSSGGPKCGRSAAEHNVLGLRRVVFVVERTLFPVSDGRIQSTILQSGVGLD